MRLSRTAASAIGSLRVLLVASIVLPVIIFVVLSWLSYQNILFGALRDLERTSEVARENVGNVFDSQSQLAAHVNDLVSDLTEDAVLAQELPLHQTLARLVARVSGVASVKVSGKDGKPLVNAANYPIDHGINLSGRDYFKALMGGYSGPFVSGLHVGEVYKHTFFGLGRTWTGPDGAVKGVIGVAVSPGFFENFYRTLLREAGNSGEVIALVRDDGQILVHFPHVDGELPPAGAARNFLAAIRQAPDGGTFEGNSLIDTANGPHLFVYRKVRGYPLYVATGWSWGAIMTGWYHAMVMHLLVGIPATLMLFALTNTALSRTLREERALRIAQNEIARREIAEQTLLRAQRLEAVGQMTGGIAHDFNNLLTVILGNASMIDRRADNPLSVRRLTSNIELAAKRGAEITQQLLAFAGRGVVRPETIDLNRRLTVFKPLLDRAASEAVQITFDLDPDLKPASIDPGQFESAILNLVGNARDAMPNGGSLKIKTRNIDGYELIEPGDELRSPGRHNSLGSAVRVTVSDAGAGMDAETVAKAFEPFFTTKGVGKGTGLGLSQVYGFARQSGGVVRIRSTPGVGTDVEIILPASSASAGDESLDDPEAAGMEVSRGKVVLVVEDEPHVLNITVDTLRELGYRTIAATDGRSALEKLAGPERVDLLFSDVVMPGGMTGVDLARQARRMQPELKVVLTSGHTGAPAADLPRNVPLLAKPYSREQLSRQLERALHE